MKYFSILSLMAAIAAFSTGANAELCVCNEDDNPCNTQLKELQDNGDLPNECFDQSASKGSCLNTLEKQKKAPACVACRGNFKCH